MSSHHIVRDEQEPALFILDFGNFQEEHLGQLLEWSPTVLVAQNMYEKISSMGIKIDVVICNKHIIEEFQQGTKILYLNVKDDTLNVGINFFINQKYPAVNLICNNFNIASIYHYVNKIDLVIFTKNKKYYPIKTGFKKWSVANLIIEVFGSKFNSQGLKHLCKSKFTTLNDGFFSLTFTDEFLFLAEDL